MEILPGIHAVPGIQWSRVYLIEDDRLALVDTGLPWNAGRVISYIKSIGRRPDELSLILITHSHPDHTSAALAIKQRTGAEIVAHALDTKSHSRLGDSLSYMGIFTSLRAPLPFLRHTPVDRAITGEEAIPVMGGIRAIHTPGHTPGSLSFLLEQRSVLFSGDTVFSDGKRVSRSVPFPGYNELDYRQSLQRLAALEFDILCGGHGSPLVGGASDRVRELLMAKPDPPSWREFLRGIPRRLYYGRSLRGEDR